MRIMSFLLLLILLLSLLLLLLLLFRTQSNISTKILPSKHDKLSTIIDLFYHNLMDENMATFLDDNIPGTAFMIDARFKPNSDDFLNNLNSILSIYGNEDNRINLVYQKSKQLNFYYQFTKYFFRVFINIRRLFLTFNISAIIFNVLLALSLYPIMALLLLHGLGVNDLFLGICFLVFFPFMFVTVACAASMADVYRLLIIDVEDGIYSALSLQCSFMVYFIFSALVICMTALGSIFVIRPFTDWFELFEALMLLNLDMLFFLGMIYFCVVANAGDPGLVFRNVTILLTFCTLFGGLLINIYKFPNFIKWVLQINPLFISAATNQYLFINSCTLIYGDQNFCRSFMMTAFGYYPYSEPGVGNGIILSWGLFFNIISWIILMLKQSTKGVYISEKQDENPLTKILTSVSTASLSSIPSNNNIFSRSSLNLTQPVPSSSERNMSKIDSLPRMIQQKSITSGFEDNASVVSHSSTNNDSDKNSKFCDGVKKSNSMPEFFSTKPHLNENKNNQAVEHGQLVKAQSMLATLPRTDEECDEVAEELHNWEHNTGILESTQKSLVVTESNPRLHALEKIRKNSITTLNNTSNNSLVDLIENKNNQNNQSSYYNSKGQHIMLDEDLDNFLNENVIQVEENDDDDDEDDQNSDEPKEKFKKINDGKQIQIQVQENNNHQQHNIQKNNIDDHKRNNNKLSEGVFRPSALHIESSNGYISSTNSNSTNSNSTNSTVHNNNKKNKGLQEKSSITSQSYHSIKGDKNSKNMLNGSSANLKKYSQKVHSKHQLDSSEVHSNVKYKKSPEKMKNESELLSF